MKFFTLLLVVAVAVGCQAYRSSWQDFSLSTEEGNSDRRNSWQSWQTDQQVDEQVSSILAASQQEVASFTPNEKWNSFATANPEVAPYQQKIFQRLQNSASFASKQNIQQNILDLALEKFNVCKSMSSQQLTIDRSCLGRSTGQMMQLISAIDNVSRNHPRGGMTSVPTEQY